MRDRPETLHTTKIVDAVHEHDPAAPAADPAARGTPILRWNGAIWAQVLIPARPEDAS